MAQTFTAAELARYNGVDGAPIYISVKGKVYDCTSGADFYGPSGPYAVFAGKEASRALGKMQISDAEANADWGNLSDEHRQTLDEWAAKLEKKYLVVGEFAPDADFVARGGRFDP